MRSVSADTTLQPTDGTLEVDCSGGDITITLQSWTQYALYSEAAIVRTDRSINKLTIVPFAGEYIEWQTQMGVPPDQYNKSVYFLQCIPGGWRNPRGKSPINLYPEVNSL
ncbi:MAG: hypothetical protein M0Z52_07300 [Actinomycetota bacterium]|nr:hypothetical protein [Actinomycetota bacterium]